MYLSGTSVPNSGRAVHDVAGWSQRRKVTVGPVDEMGPRTYVHVHPSLTRSQAMFSTSFPKRVWKYGGNLTITCGHPIPSTVDEESRRSPGATPRGQVQFSPVGS
jgi:hypothetical protein